MVHQEVVEVEGNQEQEHRVTELAEEVMEAETEVEEEQVEVEEEQVVVGEVQMEPTDSSKLRSSC